MAIAANRKPAKLASGPTSIRVPASRASPATPPMPVGSGQRAVGGRALATALALSTPTNHSAMRTPPCGRSRSRISRMPHRTGGNASMIEPSPRSCMARSATTAPGRPSTLCARWSVAWLRLGSSIDHVARATVSATAPVKRIRPPHSVSRLARKGRRLSTKVS